ncbi:MAG: hypothetical protein HUU46_05370 [Candidatus Hydrogenedentes bacterium]|nr:hypothetical protein [Candidatus Hydrogenedentota bacterium]
MDTEHHAKLRAVYERELQSAQRTIQRLLGVEQARTESLEAQRRAVLEEQLHLPERVTAGKISARDANDTNRRLTQRLADLDAQIAVCRSRLESRTSEELGGFIDLSFSEYANEEIRPMGPSLRGLPAGGPRLRDWYYSSGLALVAAVAVFLPWLSKGGVTTSLATANGGLSQLAAQAGLHPGAARYAWIVFAVVPFIGVLMTAGRNVRLFGWGFLLLGLIMLAGGALPGLVLGASGSGQAGVVQMLTSFRVGAVLYCASAIAFIVLGAFRVSPPGDSLRHAITVSLALLGAVGAIGLLAAFALFGVQGMSRVTFRAVLDTATNDRIAFTIVNEGREPIACYFQMPSTSDGTASLARDSHTYDVRVAVREQGRDAFSTIPASSRVWNLVQGPLPEDQQMLVSAGSELKGSLDLRQLSALGVEPASVRIQLVSLDGSLVSEAEVELEDRYLSVPGPIRDPLIIAPPPPRPTAAAAAAPAVPAPSGQTQPEPGEALRVEFVGAIGGKAIVHVFSPDGASYVEAVAGPGEPVTSDWVVESLVRQPSSVNMKHTKTGASAQVIRGNVVEIRSTPSQ